MGIDQFTDQRHDAGDDLFLAVIIVGKEGIVGDINIVRIGTRGHDLTQDREPAKA